tara:strand:+ start:47 stop:220 length:174 start_codon:yes stop_codon:yes gene_type:complete
VVLVQVVIIKVLVDQILHLIQVSQLVVAEVVEVIHLELVILLLMVFQVDLVVGLVEE